MIRIKFLKFDETAIQRSQVAKGYLCLQVSNRGKSISATEAGCLAHARRKFHELWAKHGSPVGEQLLKFFGKLCDIERDVAALAAEERKRIRHERARKVADALHQWLTAQRQKVPER